MRLDRLINFRESLDLNQKQLAEKLCVSPRCYSHYESGKRSINFDLLCRIAILFNTSTDYLLGLTDEKCPYPRSKDLPREAAPKTTL